MQILRFIAKVVAAVMFATTSVVGLVSLVPDTSDTLAQLPQLHE